MIICVIFVLSQKCIILFSNMYIKLNIWEVNGAIIYIGSHRLPNRLVGVRSNFDKTLFCWNQNLMEK